MTLATKVGKHIIPVKGQYATTLRFTGGEGGKKEAGDYAFWTVELKEPRPYWNNPKKMKRKVWGRAYIALDAGNRFDRMRDEGRSKEEQKVYRHMYRVMFGSGANIKLIRPSTAKEVDGWLGTHRADAKYADDILRTGNGKVELLIRPDE